MADVQKLKIIRYSTKIQVVIAAIGSFLFHMNTKCNFRLRAEIAFPSAIRSTRLRFCGDYEIKPGCTPATRRKVGTSADQTRLNAAIPDCTVDVTRETKLALRGRAFSPPWSVCRLHALRMPHRPEDYSGEPEAVLLYHVMCKTVMRAAAVALPRDRIS